MQKKPKLIVFASGTKTGGGSGFENLVAASRAGRPDVNFDVVGVVSNWEHGGVWERADRLDVPFVHLGKEQRTAGDYEQVVQESGAEWVALSGWLKLAPMKSASSASEPGLDPARTINIHPGPLPAFGGAGMYGHFVHEAVLEAYRRGEVTHSAVSMHFVTKIYDEGPKFFHYPVAIKPDDTPETLGKRVNADEHQWQPYITSFVVNGEISWDGAHPESLVVPRGYEWL